MGFIRVKCSVGSADGKMIKDVDFLTDTGSFYTVIPPNLAKELNIKSLATTKLLSYDKTDVSG